MALIGILVMVGGGLVIGTMRGNLLALGASLGFATFSVLLRRGRERDMMPCVVIAGLVSGLIALPLVLAEASSMTSALAQDAAEKSVDQAISDALASSP